MALVASDPKYLIRVNLPRSAISGAVVIVTMLRDQELEEALDQSERKGQRAKMASLFAARAPRTTAPEIAGQHGPGIP